MCKTCEKKKKPNSEDLLLDMIYRTKFNERGELMVPYLPPYSEVLRLEALLKTPYKHTSLHDGNAPVKRKPITPASPGKTPAPKRRRASPPALKEKLRPARTQRKLNFNIPIPRPVSKKVPRRLTFEDVSHSKR